MFLKKNDKIIISFYVLLAISFSFGVLYVSTTFEDLPTPTWVFEKLTFLEFEKTLEIEQERLFLTMSDLENYPKILPQTFVSVNILEINENIIITEEVIQEKGIRTKLLVKHTLIPNDEHIFEILEGDAKGTKIHQFFSSNGNFTNLKTTVDINFEGILIPFSYLPKNNVQHAMDTVTTAFYDYSKRSYTLEQKQIDDLYREILLRPADKKSLEYFSELLGSSQITMDDIKFELLNSEEAKNIIKPSELKQINELKDETIIEIEKIYREILQRPYDEEGMKHYGTLLELKKLSLDDIEKQLFYSEEALSIRLSYPVEKMIDDLYLEVHGKHADIDILNHYKVLFVNNKMTSEDIKVDMLDNLIEP